MGPVIMGILREFTGILTSDFGPEESDLMWGLLERMHENVLCSRYSGTDESEGGCPDA